MPDLVANVHDAVGGGGGFHKARVNSARSRHGTKNNETISGRIFKKKNGFFFIVRETNTNNTIRRKKIRDRLREKRGRWLSREMPPRTGATQPDPPGAAVGRAL